MMIFLKSDTVARSMAEASSESWCHTEGKGTVMRWRMGTPGKRGVANKVGQCVQG